jgi:proline racemase
MFDGNRARHTSLAVTTCDYHTAGEPFRIVTGGVPDIPGSSVLERRAAAEQTDSIDVIRRLLCHEPRGHADMYGCFVVPPDDDGADFGALFWHKDGYSTACGHGSIALGRWAVESGLVDAETTGETTVTIDVPSGRITSHVRLHDGAIQTIAFDNVPAYVLARNIPVCGVEVDVSYGGAIYASVPASALGLRVDPSDISELIAQGRKIKHALNATDVAKHPIDDRLSGIYGTIIYDIVEPLHQRNVTVFADGEVDRSPCGSGTSARCALLHADGEMKPGQSLLHESIIGTTFSGHLLGDSDKGVLTQVEGTAFPTGEHRFVLDTQDSLGTGFVLR